MIDRSPFATRFTVVCKEDPLGVPSLKNFKQDGKYQAAQHISVYKVWFGILDDDFDVLNESAFKRYFEREFV